MARYKIGIFNRKEGRIIDLESITKLEKLENLDNFTTAFNNESELKIYLFNQGLITNEELKENISIMYKYNGKIKKLNIFYQDMKKYLDMVHLRFELKGLSSNLEFLEKLANFYSNGSTSFNKQGLNVSDIRHYLSDVRRNGGETFYSTMLETAIEDLFKKAIIRTVNTQTGEVKEDYKGLRDLAYFIYKFKKSRETKIENKPIAPEIVGEQNSLFDEGYVKMFLSEVEEPQNTKWQLSSEGDPDFPPNSEEEAAYIRYMEELQNKPLDMESNPHYRR